jgi:hypothetical protein
LGFSASSTDDPEAEMMKPLCTFSLALLLASAPAAFAQTGGTGGGGMPAGTQMRPDADPSMRGRMGPGQRPLELVQTTLLNRFGGLGFHRIVDIRRAGANYLATVETVQGNNVVLTIDPETGQIVSERPVTSTEAAAVATPGAAGATAGGMAGGMAGGASGGMAGGGMTGGQAPGMQSPMQSPMQGQMQGRQMAGVSCGPADWNPLEQAIGRLPPDRTAAAQRMLVDVYDRHAANDAVGCRGRVEDLRSYLRENRALP